MPAEAAAAVRSVVSLLSLSGGRERYASGASNQPSSGLLAQIHKLSDTYLQVLAAQSMGSNELAAYDTGLSMRQMPEIIRSTAWSLAAPPAAGCPSRRPDNYLTRAPAITLP